ncbi:hypothetical protein ZWY2020_011305, partial [Hordeum vulgare]
MFIVVMYNDCPRNGRGGAAADCVGRSVLRRFSFQPLKENPSSAPPPPHERLHTIFRRSNLSIHGDSLLQSERSAWSTSSRGLGGSVLSVLFIQERRFSVGASGALFELLGPCCPELSSPTGPSTPTGYALISPLLSSRGHGANLIIIAAINRGAGDTPAGVDNFLRTSAEFFTGFLLGFVLLIQLRPGSGWLEQPFGGQDQVQVHGMRRSSFLV